MVRHKSHFVFLCSGLILLTLYGSEAFADPITLNTLPGPVRNVLKRYRIPERSLSVFVQDVGGHAPLLAVSEQTPRNPASTIKLLTTFIALDELGPAYTWKTEAYTAAPIRNGRLDGDLYLKGYGDPYLVVEYFWKFLRGLRHTGLGHIAGDLVVDSSYFDPKWENPASFDGRPHRAYNVLPNAMLLNYQAIHFKFLPDVTARRLRIIADPKPQNLEINNRVKLTKGRCYNWGSRLNMRISRNGKRDTVSFDGRYPAACGENDIYRVVSGSDAYFYGVFRSMWEEQGGRLDGALRRGKVPPNARLLHTATSPPLADIIRGINKYSNNVMARQVLLTLGAEKLGPPGTTEKGKQVIRSWLARHGLKFRELVLDNGAGRSRETRISARHLGEFLLEAYKSPYMPEFVSSMPLAAMDGTLRKRFVDHPLKGRMHIKTGRLDYVLGMAGYMLNRKGRTLAVVSLHNHSKAHTGAGERVQDALLKWLYEYDPPL